MRTDFLRRYSLAACLSLAIGSFSTPLFAQSTDNIPPSPPPTASPKNAVPTESVVKAEEGQDSAKLLTAEEIQQRLSTLESASIDEVDKRKATEFYQKALSSLSVIEQKQNDLAHFENLKASYEQDLKNNKEGLANLPSEVPGIDDGKTLTELEDELARREQAFVDLRSELEKANTLLKNRTDWLANYPKKLADTQLEFDRAKQESEKFSAAEKTGVVADAERASLKASEEALAKTLLVIEKRRQYYLMSGDLAQVRRDYRAKQVSLDEKYLATLREVVNQQRLADANQQASAAASAAAVQRPEAIAKLATANAALAKDQAAIVSKISALDKELTATKSQLLKVADDKKLSEERVKAAGLTEASGQQLRQQQELLPDNRGIAREIALRETEKSDAVYTQYKLLDQRNEIEDADLEARVAGILELVPADQRATAEQEIRSLLDSERKILDSTFDNYGKYVKNLNDLTAAQEELIRTTNEYREFIAEHILWIRSCSWPRLADLEPAAGALAWSLDPANWQAALTAFWARTGKSPLVVSIFALVLLVSLYYHRRLRVRLRELGEQAAKRTTSEFLPTFKALCITLLLALPWPALLAFVGWWIDSPLNESEFVRALSASLLFTALCLLRLEVVRHMCRSGGLADAHFGWSQAGLGQVRRHVRLLIWVGLPLVFWLTGLELQNVEKLWSSTLGRACYVAVMLIVAITCYRILLSHRSPFRQLWASHSEKGISLYTFWTPMVTALPLLLALLAVVGYYYTAQQLTLRLLQTAVLVFSLIVIGGLTRRWILLNRRRLARELAKQKRAAALAAAEAAAAGGETPAITSAELVEDSVDLVALGEQTIKLVVTILMFIGLASAWFIWGEMLPALARVDQWEIFPQEGVEDLLTWGQLLKFFLVVIITFVAARNVPALLEFAVLQYLPMDSGSRYAVTSICRYVLVAIGMVMAYTSLGFDGTSIQWLVAAMGVGLGFGLQEIFANFVSGIILLFERPIRVGDIVTLGEKTGAVSRIRMRATTLVDMERKEYIVPNKDFVTERLLNWTLSDQTIRIEILVGVAYGSDTELACRLLREAAAEHPHILKEPEPLATFFGFGDSALSLRLFAFISNLEKRLQTTHDLHTAIDKKFKEAGLEIAFPQTDLHIRSLPPDWHQQSSQHSQPANGRAAESTGSKT
ncbi:mechanosensitive ion channel domain-containing protein [Bythopirellula polymerisocia]|uniref:Miniconductance mechanosensitive channel MscM n=1 Tax=Bythopirellula polymerisocia TaxID=2528003 RepID=A0A5C6D187_9BACT|nr:mechanosensitive ion channel domain-containing protein [Bythopirellula polymerisocia]TWU29511.1 Miniconductance mechanosensitive channel MscM precursor [Bythopirellula polymerisocia]